MDGRAGAASDRRHHCSIQGRQDCTEPIRCSAAQGRRCGHSTSEPAWRSSTATGNDAARNAADDDGSARSDATHDGHATATDDGPHDGTAARHGNAAADARNVIRMDQKEEQRFVFYIHCCIEIQQLFVGFITI